MSVTHAVVVYQINVVLLHLVCPRIIYDLLLLTTIYFLLLLSQFVEKVQTLKNNKRNDNFWFYRA